MRSIIIIISLCCISNLNAQIDSTALDDRYREDQFYASVTYNLLANTSNSISQNGLSTGFHFGVIRDMPINKRRNLAFGLGLGISSNSYNQNILISEAVDGYNFNIIDESTINVNKNKFTTYLLEVPFEFRWRTSTAAEYRFWRIYAGFKLGYLVYNTAKFTSNNTNDIRLSNIDAFNDLQYGLTLSAGYGTWNFQVYYALNPIFDDNAKLNDRTIDVRTIKVGLIFYIL